MHRHVRQTGAIKISLQSSNNTNVGVIQISNTNSKTVGLEPGLDCFKGLETTKVTEVSEVTCPPKKSSGSFVLVELTAVTLE